MSSIQEQVRKEKSSTFNRLHSIDEDARFVQLISETYNHLPVIANQRCGAWYVDPSAARSSNEWAYFKSTDGHHGRWDFSLRRANLHLLPLIDRCSGAILVDSTRRGKRFPDALSKTIPIWCSVINTALQMIYGVQSPAWDCSLYTSPKLVSLSERSQIEPLIGSWSQKLASSSFVLHRLGKPLRPLWISPSSTSFPQLPPASYAEFFPVICVSASRLVQDELPGGIERRAGYTYVQGSGDDHELWSQGLDPPMFWQHRSPLLEADASELDEVIRELVQQRADPEYDFVPNNASRFFPITKVEDQVKLVPSASSLTSSPESCESTALIFIDIGNNPYVDLSVENSRVPALYFHAPRTALGKKRDFSSLLSVDNLDRCVSFARFHLGGERPARRPTLCIASVVGQNDALVGVTIAILQCIFDDEGRFRDLSGWTGDNDNFANASKATKETLRTRLQWVQASVPELNPSRTVLKLVNGYFMSPRKPSKSPM